MGIGCELPNLSTFENFPSGYLRPIPGTVRPLVWSSSSGQKIGHVICEMSFKGSPLDCCPRVVALKQLERLEQKGWSMKSAFECEFDASYFLFVLMFFLKKNKCQNVLIR